MRIAVLDVGGTNIKSGIFEEGKLVECKEIATNAKLGGEHVMNTMLEILGEYQDFEAVGISTAGQVDAKHGTILYANHNIPGYTGMKIKERVQQRFQVPVAVANDVNSAALGEAAFGAGREYSDFLCLTYGTGVGGAIIMNRQVYCGAGFLAGEFGAIITHPIERDVNADPFSGCYETYASTTALIKRVQQEFPELTNGREIFSQKEKPEMKQIIDVWVGEIAQGLATLIHIFNPSLIVLGGGVMEQDFLVNAIEKKVKEQVVPSFTDVKLVRAQLGNKAGMLGAARNVLNLMEQ